MHAEATLERLKERVARHFVEIHLGQAELRHVLRVEIADRIREEHFTLQTGGDGQDVTDREVYGAELADNLEHLWQVGNVASHGDEDHADLRFSALVTLAQRAETLHIGNDVGRFSAQAHIGVTLQRCTVDRNPQQVETSIDELATALFDQQRAVGDHLHVYAKLLDLRDPVNCTLVKRRLADTAKVDRRKRIDLLQTLQHGDGGFRLCDR